MIGGIPDGMSRTLGALIISITLVSSALTEVGPGPVSANEAQLGWTIDLDGDEVTDIASAPAEGVYAAGLFDGAAGIKRYDANGSLIWERALVLSGTSASVVAGPDGPITGISADPAVVVGSGGDGSTEWSASGIDVTRIAAIGSASTGDSYVVGSFANPDDPDPFFAARTTTLTKFDPDGAEEWSVELDDGTGVRFIVAGIDVLADGRVVVAAYRRGVIGLPGDAQLVVFDETGEKVASIDSIWDDLDPFVRSALSIGVSTLSDVTAHPDGGFVVTGAPFEEIMIARFDANLERQWLRIPDDAAAGALDEVAVAPSGDIVTAGPAQDGGVGIRSFTPTGSVLWTVPVATEVDARSIRLALVGEDAVAVSYQRVESNLTVGSTILRLTTAHLGRAELCNVAPEHPFTDVGSGGRVAADAGCLFALGVTNGVSATAYGPSASVTREQMGAFMARLVRLVVGVDCSRTMLPGGTTGPDIPLQFDDVPESSFAYDDIGCIANFGITNGTSPTTYGPADPVTREQMGAFLARLHRLLSGDACTGHPLVFEDVSASSFARDDIACIHQLGITTGTSATTYSPGDFVTRGQMASFLSRLYRLLV